MPLIIVTGLPCSGKTFRADQILQDFQTRIESSKQSDTTRSVVLLPSHHASLDPSTPTSDSYSPPEYTQNPRDHIYSLAAAEKTARAEEFSAIKRAVTKNAIVIADAPNYIKGFRYQLWCEAKAAGTRCVVVHAAAREDECRTWNDERLRAWGWPYDDPASQSETVPKSTGPRVGKDVLGELMPESHTALYGDRASNSEATASYGLRDGAGTSDDGRGYTRHPANGSAREEDAMTLQSLYINKQTSKPIQPQSTQTDENGTKPVTSSEDTTTPAPCSTPPTPKYSLPYSSSTFTSLAMRYEPPSPFSRWDTPLFTVPSDDGHPPYAAIWEALFPIPSKPMSKKALSQQAAQPQAAAGGAAASQQGANEAGKNKLLQQVEGVKQHAATVLPAATGANALQILEHATGDVVKAILATARDRGVADGAGGEITFSVPDVTAAAKTGGDATAEGYLDGTARIEATMELPMGTVLSQPMLQRLRRKYTQIQRGGIAHGQGYARSRREAVDGFVRFLEREWDV